MKKYTLIFVTICLALGFLVNVNPVSALDGSAPVPTKRVLYRTPTKTAQPTQTQVQPVLTATSTPQSRYDESLKSIFYTGLWNNCLTLMVDNHPDYETSEIISYCKSNIQMMINNHAYEYRHSDMFKPLPTEIDIYK